MMKSFFMQTKKTWIRLADEQAGQNRRRAHISEGTFSYVAPYLINAVTSSLSSE